MLQIQPSASGDGHGYPSGHPSEENTLLIPDFITTPQHDTDQLNKDLILQELARKQFPIEESELIFKGFERVNEDDHFEKSYVNSCPLRDVVHGTMAPTVSIVFLAGADKMSVNQDEQKGMTSTDPLQRTPRWRVLTAGTLLCNFEIDDSLALRQTDRTPEIVSKIRENRPPEPTESPLSRALSLKSQSREDRILTIDSDNVRIVNWLKPGSTDLEATLIEVDKHSIFSLLVDFHKFVRNGGAAMISDNESRVRLLEVMVENAQRMAIRSPILFRMSTRRQIACSKNTRYGVDHGTQFETITTSVGIKNIISKSAACYNSLASPGEQNNSDQDLIRPKFLQMLTLLLSLLNDADLSDIAPFLESTYRVKADRPSIELLILKVLPLQSINKRIFTRELYFAAQPQSQLSRGAGLPDSEEEIWNRLITKLLNQGYILPGFTEQMGQFDKSWIVKYPEGDGIKDSYVFNNLQFADEHSTINNIPYMDLGMSKRTGEVTSTMANKKRYSMSVADHSRITAMMFGTYPLTETTGQRRTHNLFISEAVVNDSLNHAIQKTNQMLGIVNRYFAGPRIKRKLVKSMVSTLDLLSFQPPKDRGAVTMPDITSCGRLTFHEAQLGEQRDQLLAVSYKVEGKKIAREDLIRNMAADAGKVRTALHRIVMEIHRYESRRVDESTRFTIVEIKKRMPEIEALLAQADKNRTALQNAHLNTSNEPIEQTIYPIGAAVQGVIHWSPYRHRLVDGRLHVEAHRYQVQNVKWINEEIIEVYFRDEVKKFFLSPLRRLLPEQRQWEIRADDKVLMVGQYIVIVVPEDDEEVELPAPELEYRYPAPPQQQIRIPSDGSGYGLPPNHNGGQQHPHQRIPSGGSGNYPVPYPANPANPAPYPSPQTTSPGRANRGEQYVAYNDRYARAREARPEIFANWIKVVGVEQGMTDPRKKNRRRFSSWSESVFH